MLMYPEEYLEFSRLVKEYVLLNILLKVLNYDRKNIKSSQCKFNSIYGEALLKIELQIERDFISVKKRIKSLGGLIIEEEQQPSVRIVKAKFRGFIYTHRFLNYVLQAESEKLFKGYIIEINFI